MDTLLREGYLGICPQIIKGSLMIIRGEKQETSANLTKGLFRKSNQIITKKDTFDINTIEVLQEYSDVFEEIQREPSLIFVTGKAGTGKSTFIHYIRSKVPLCAIVAPTSLAAANIDGCTMHRFFSMPLIIEDPTDVPNIKHHTTSLIKSLKLLIIDEISMVNAAQIDLMHHVLKKVLRNDKPFGGISVLFVGDLFQLPPIISDDEIAKYFNDRYESPFFMSADILQKNNLKRIELKKVFRQQGEDDFIAVLDQIRTKDEFYQEALEFLNQQSIDNFNVTSSLENTIHLVPTKAVALSINDMKLNSLVGNTYTFQAELKNIDINEIREFLAPDVLELKVGAQVIFVKSGTSWVNGSIGKVVEIPNTEEIRVKLLDTGVVVAVHRDSWDKIEYFYNIDKKTIETKVIGSYIQFPLALGWAITIHKSQGMTLDKVVVDMGHGAFAEGQTYVALSRCKTLAGLKLSRPLKESDIKVHESIKEFYHRLFG